MGPKIDRKSIKNGAEKTTEKRPRKVANVKYGTIDRWSTDASRGDKEGEPSRYGGIPVKIPAGSRGDSNTQAPRWGMANLIRCAKIAVPQRHPGE